MFDRVVSVVGKVLDQKFLGNDAGLGQAVHSLADFNVNISVVYFLVEVVVGDDFL